MFVRFLIACVCVLSVSGCGGGGSSSPSVSTIPVATELAVYGVSENAVINRDYLYVTVDRSKSVFRQYTTFEYTVDTQLGGYTPAHFDDPDNKNIKRLTIPINSEGPHQLAVRGVLKKDPGDGTYHQELGTTINFTVQYMLDKVAKGKYFGDRTVYKAPFSSFSGMRVQFVSYSAARFGSTLTGGGMTLADVGSGATTAFTGTNGFGAAISPIQIQAHASVDFQLNSGTEFLKASGTGYSQFMELLLLQGVGSLADRQGDLRLYRTDFGSRVLSASSSSLKGYLGTSPERQAVITLQSFDNINFFGHLRLWNKGSLKVWTYQVSAYADAKGLDGTNNGLFLWLSTASSPLDDFLLGVTPYPDAYSNLNPPGCPPSTRPGYLTVTTDASGVLTVNQLSLKLDDIYDAAAGSLSTKASYKP